MVLLKETNDGVLRLTMNRPERLNALTHDLVRELWTAVRQASVDPRVAVVMLAGSGTSFCSGGDLREMANPDPGDPVSMAAHDHPAWHTPDARSERTRRSSELAYLLRTMPKPTIAAVRGHAVGAGLSLALACDFRIASVSARLKAGFVSAGLAGDYGITHSLLTLAGLSRARSMLMFDEPVAAAEALALGLVDRVTEEAELDEAVTAMALRLARGPKRAYRAIKANIDHALTSSYFESLNHEANGQAALLYSDDAREAGRAFVEKRKPVFAP